MYKLLYRNQIMFQEFLKILFAVIELQYLLVYSPS